MWDDDKNNRDILSLDRNKQAVELVTKELARRMSCSRKTSMLHIWCEIRHTVFSFLNRNPHLLSCLAYDVLFASLVVCERAHNTVPVCGDADKNDNMFVFALLWIANKMVTDVGSDMLNLSDCIDFCGISQEEADKEKAKAQVRQMELALLKQAEWRVLVTASDIAQVADSLGFCL